MKVLLKINTAYDCERLNIAVNEAGLDFVPCSSPSGSFELIHLPKDSPMAERKRYYPYGGPAFRGAIPPGVFDTHYKRFHDRPEYTREQAQGVVAWLNGKDRPLPTMVQREHDTWDPGRPKHLRGKPEPYPWIVGRTRLED